MLHEVGNYVNPAGRHRHTYYIVSNSELFGFTPLQRKIIATIARFQGNSKPQLRDRLIKVLPAQLRSDQGRNSAVHSLRATARDGRLIIGVKAGRAGADLEMWAGEKEIPYFREVFGRELIFKLV